MKTKLLNILAVYAVFAAMVLALTSCQSMKHDATPRDKYADAERSFQVAVDAATVAFRTGRLTGDRLALVKAALIEANGALAEMNLRLKTSDQIEADYWVGRVTSAVNAAMQYLSESTTQG